jgi:hypothetical protein
MNTETYERTTAYRSCGDTRAHSSHTTNYYRGGRLERVEHCGGSNGNGEQAVSLDRVKATRASF